MQLVTAAEMRLLDRATIETGHASGDELMERAGQGLVATMERQYGALLGMRVLVLCGTGNNGGDGFVAARWLKGRGAGVHVGLVGDAAKMRWSRTRISRPGRCSPCACCVSAARATTLVTASSRRAGSRAGAPRCTWAWWATRRRSAATPAPTSDGSSRSGCACTPSPRASIWSG